jgi:hypothetical protein
MADDPAQGGDGHRSGASASSPGTRRLLVMAATLLCSSGFLLHTLVLGERYLERDRNAVVETTVAIGVPAFAGLVFVAVALRLIHRSR